MAATVQPEMLWESADPGSELRNRFGFASAESAAAWALGMLADDYGLQAVSLDRMVISFHNLMFWVTVAHERRLMVKVCRLTEAHDRLKARSGLVSWLADRNLPVAPPLPSCGGDRQVLRDGRSISVQPVLAGDLLEADDLDQVRAAGSTLADLHIELASWPDANSLGHAQPVAGVKGLWAYPAGHAEVVPAELQARLERRIVNLPELAHQPVHSDFRGANVLWQAGRITGVVDFEEARNDAAVVDLAHAVCLLGTHYRNWKPMTPQAQILFLDSYTEHRPLTRAEQTWLRPLIAWGMLGQGWWDEADRWLT